MLKRFSSLILVLVIGGSVMAGAARPHDEHICKMTGMEMMPGMENMSHGNADESPAVVNGSDSSLPCYVTIPQETGSRGTTFNLRPPSFSIAVIHPAVVQSSLAPPQRTECSHSIEVFLPNLQASYIRNLALLI